jgi:site-specific DNA recombinase
LPKNSHTNYPTAEHERIVIPVPALVDADLFATVSEQLEENRRRLRATRRPGRYLLQGLLACECCGYAFYGKPICNSSGDGQQRFYAYYRCVGTDGYRFGGQRVCDNGQCRSDYLDRVVWNDVAALLADPDRVRHEYQRRRDEQNRSDSRPSAQLDKLIATARGTINRLIDAFETGVLEKAEFEPRLRSARERLARLEAEQQTTRQRQAETADLNASINQLEMFAQQVGTSLADADWNTRQSIVRALIKEVKIGKDNLRIVYKVKPPFDQGPNKRGILQDCAGRTNVTMSKRRSL